MPHPKLDNLVTTGVLKVEPPAASELAGLVRAGTAKLADAQNEALALESRFDLAYSAAHAFALAALRHYGYRPDNKRYIVFQVLGHTLNLSAAKCRVLSDAHRKRNLSEYEGAVDVEESTVEELVRLVAELADLVAKLPPLA